MVKILTLAVSSFILSLVPYQANCCNERLLDLTADSFNERILSKVPVPIELIQDHLEFLEGDSEEIIEKFSSERKFYELCSSKVKDIANPEFQKFAHNCEEMYKFYAGWDSLTQAAIYLLFEKVADKTERSKVSLNTQHIETEFPKELKKTNSVQPALDSDQEDSPELPDDIMKNIKMYFEKLEENYKGLLKGDIASTNNLSKSFLDKSSTNDLALALCRLSASSGNPEGLFNLAYIQEGDIFGHTKQDLKKSFENYMKSAKLGYTSAMHKLCDIYLNPGKFSPYVQRDFKKSLEWLEVAAEAHDPYSLKALGDMYAHGNETYHIQKNVPLAIGYYKEALKYELIEAIKLVIEKRISALEK